MIIVEGPDGAGKTTLAHKIAEYFGIEYRRAPTLSSRHGPNEQVRTWWYEHLTNPHREDAVYDRCTFISDPIYSTVAQREPLDSYDELFKATIQLVRKEPMIIWCLPPWAIQWTNIRSDREGQLSSIEEGDFEQINYLYHWAAALTYHMRWRATYDFTRDSQEHILAHCAAYRAIHWKGGRGEAESTAG